MLLVTARMYNNVLFLLLLRCFLGDFSLSRFSTCKFLLFFSFIWEFLDTNISIIFYGMIEMYVCVIVECVIITINASADVASIILSNSRLRI